MINIIICDDVDKHLSYTKNLVENCLEGQEIEITCYNKAEILLKDVLSNTILPDIAILDIALKNVDGIELARNINNNIPNCRVIFLTGFINYASDVYTVDHIFFIHKDSAKKYLPLALKKAESQIKSYVQPSKDVFFRANGKIVSVQKNDIVFIERSLRKTVIVTPEDNYIVNNTPFEILGNGLERNFIHCHQSFWANYDWISEIDTDCFTMKNKMKVPISRANKSSSKEKFISYISQKYDNK